AQRRGDNRRYRRDHSNIGKSFSSAKANEEISHNCETNNRAGRSANSLKKPPRNQGVDRGRNGASEGRSGEHGAPDQKRGPPAQAIAQRSENDLTDPESGHEKTKNQCGRSWWRVEREADMREGGET